MERNTSPPKETRKRAKFLAALPYLIMIAATLIAIGIFLAMWKLEQDSFRGLFAEKVKRRAMAIARVFRGRRDVLPALAALFHSLPTDAPIPRANFSRFTSVIPSELPVMVAHVIVVQGKEGRKRYEEAVGRPMVHIQNLSDPTPEKPVYFATLNSIDPEFASLDLSAQPTAKAAFEKAWREGGVHDSRTWSPFWHKFVSTSLMPVYKDSITRPEWATPGEKHMEAVAGFAFIADLLAPALPDILGRFEPLDARVQVWIDSSLIDYPPPVPEVLVAEAGPSSNLAEEYEEQTTIIGAEAPMRLSFTPTRSLVSENTWKRNYSIVGVPLTVMVVGYGSALFLWYYQRQYDLVERLRKETEDALLSRTKFLAYLCHELRNPLNATKGFIEWLRETPLSEEQAEYVDGLNTGFQHMLKVANDTLDLGKLEAGKAHIERVQFDLCEVMRTIIKLHKTEADMKGLLLRVKARPNTPCRVYGDPVRFRQIVSNLLSNAIKVTEEGSVSVCVCLGAADEKIEETRPCSELCPDLPSFAGISHGKLKMWPPQETPEGRQLTPAVLTINVIDQGPGIPPKLLPALFIAYSQPVLNVGRTAGTGTGLGLSFVKALVRCWGGDVTVRSQVGKGSSFLVRLPVWVDNATSTECQLEECFQRSLDTTPRERLRRLREIQIPLPSPEEVVRDTVPDEALLRKSELAASVSELDMAAQLPTASATAASPTGTAISAASRTARPQVSDLEEIMLVSPAGRAQCPVVAVCSAKECAASQGSGAAGPCAGCRSAHSNGEDRDNTHGAPAGSVQEAFTGRAALRKSPSPPAEAVSEPSASSLLEGLTTSTAADDEDSGVGLSPSGTELTLQQAQQEREVKGQAGSGRDEKNTSGLGGKPRAFTVLAVDDSDLNLKIISRKLQKMGYNVVTARNGKEAVDAALSATTPLDLIIMDLQMPVMDGHEATLLLRSLGCKVPVVALTGSVTDEERQRCRQSGMVGFLGKPLEDGELKGILDKFLGKPP